MTVGDAIVWSALAAFAAVVLTVVALAVYCVLLAIDVRRRP